MKILLADDSLTIRRLVSNLLESMGHTDLIEAECGEDALALLGQHSDVELILLDWNMPPVNGLECLKVIRATPATQAIPVVMITANASKTDAIEALKCGATSYLMKPFDADRLKGMIEKVTAKRA